jgi:hypothetical protein
MAFGRNGKKTYRKSVAITAGDAIVELLKLYQLEGKFNETYVVANWEKIMGKTISSRTEKIYFKNKLMFLKLSSSPLKKDMILSKQTIIDLINKEARTKVVEDLIFL